MSDLHNKKKIFRVAADLFSKKGFHAVPIQEICDQAGVTKPTLYYYFKSKKTLHNQLIKEATECFDGYVSLAVRKDLDFFANLERMFEEVRRFVLDNPDYIRFILRLHLVDLIEDEDVFESEYHLEKMKKLRSFFQKGIEEGDLPKDLDLDMACAFFLGTTNFLVSHILKKNKLFSHEDPDLTKKLTFFLKKMYT